MRVSECVSACERFFCGGGGGMVVVRRGEGGEGDGVVGKGVIRSSHSD